MSLPLEAVLTQLGANRAAAIERWKEFLRIPSIGTDPARSADTRRAAEWLVETLRSIGYEASLRATAGQPMVVGHHPGPGNGGPHVLYYGHYDVQPVEPLELWSSPPFEPTMVTTERGPRLVARGAVDDKGQVLTWLEALRAWHDVQGAPPVPVSVFLEGEEESGSPSLVPFLAANQDELHGRHLRRLRHRHVGHRHARDHDHAARPDLRRADAPRPVARPALGHVRRRGAQPAQPSDPGAGPASRRRGAGADSGLLRRRARARGSPAVGGAAVRRGGFPRRRRHRDAVRRGRALDARAHLVAPDLRHQRHLRRLHRPGRRRP